MRSTRLVSVLGLGFGDCGKGLFTDYLCHRWQAHTVVRFNGGAQAAHNVVLGDGRHHTFSQFGAGTFVPGTITVLAYPVVVHPTALLVENAYLQRVGVHDALQRIVIDGRCRVTTPFHQAAGRLRELERGAAAHGSCGVGVGETVRHALEHPDQAIRYADLANTATALDKLEATRVTLRAACEGARKTFGDQGAHDAELAVLDDATMAARWLEQARELTRQVQPASRERIAERLHLPGTVVFEGAQGILLDEWRGFHPHTSWSSVGAAAVHEVAADAGQTVKIHHLGVLRTYLTRHGHGPLPTHDPQLGRLPEPHNGTGTWQGDFRRGHPDALLLRYALAVAGTLDGLLVSHLDVFEHERALRWCSAYHAGPGDDWNDVCTRAPGSGLVTALMPGASGDLAHQSRLTGLLRAARPRYESRPIAGAAHFLDDLAGVAGLPVLCGSYGPTRQAVQALQPLRGRPAVFD